MVNQLTDATFENDVLKADKTVFVDFYADWCGPCKMVSPVVEELSNQYGDKINFFKCNVDDNQATAQKYGIMSIPTMMIFKDGKADTPIVGAQPKKVIESALQKY